MTNLGHYRGEVWHHVTMEAKFLDHQWTTIESLSNDDGDGNEYGKKNKTKKQYVYISKTTTSHLHHAFLHIS